MKLLTADQMRALEQRADKSGNTFAMMMERAGKAVADAIAARVDVKDQRVLVLVGPGNNGGDGLVCARYLHDAGSRVALYVWKRADDASDENLNLCHERKIAVTRAEDDKNFDELKKRINECDVIVDALLGTGVTRPIEDLLKDLLFVVKKESPRRRVAASPLQFLSPAPLLPRSSAPIVVAVDLPSGLNPNTGALDPATPHADLTVTFAFPKIGQLTFPGAETVGELVVANIGIPTEWASDVKVEVASAREIAALLPTRSRTSHKGTFGKAMICAGSANYTGAAFLAGSAATRAGAGLVTLALARMIYPIVAAALHETTFLVLPDDLGALVPDAAKLLRKRIADYDALLIGPGFGREVKTVEFVQRLLEIGTKTKSEVGFAIKIEETKSELAELPPLVIDADALYALSQFHEWWQPLKPNAAILTPHPGEMAMLCGLSRDEIQADRIGVAREFAAQWHQVLILKGAHTVVAAPDGRVTVIPFATPALATAGTGDVLAGTIVAMLAQKLSLFEAALVGAYLHGLAGKIAEEEIGNAGVVAGDLLTRLPEARKRVCADFANSGIIRAEQ